MAGASVASIWADLKEYMDSQEMMDLIYKTNPFYGMVKKNAGVEGKYFPQPLVVAGSAGGGANFANAQENITASVQRAFNVPTFQYFQLGQISGLGNALSASSAGAYEEGMKVEMDSAMRELTKALSIYLYRDGTGVIGTISSFTATGVIQLATPADAYNFIPGQALQCFNSSYALQGTGAAYYVTQVDVSTGKITISATRGGAAATPSGWDAAEFLVQQGNVNSVVAGLSAWLPATTPTSTDNFFGVNRSISPSLLAGVRYDGSNLPVEEALIDFLSLICTNGGQPDLVFMNPVSYRSVAKALQARHGYVDVVTEAGISYKAMAIESDLGKVGIISDRNCPAQTAYGLQMNTWTLGSAGKSVRVWNDDGMEYLRAPNADAIQFRLVSYSGLACSAPGWNGRCTLSV